MPEAVLKELGDVTAWSSVKGKDIKCTSLRALQEVNERNTGSKSPRILGQGLESLLPG